MRREDLRWTIPGAISGQNTSRSDYHVDWRANAEQTEIWTTHAIIREGSGPSASCELVANVPPWPSEGPFTVALLQKTLASRYEAHPLANQLPGALLLVAKVLEGGANPLEVVRSSARYACPGGVCRAFGYLLTQDPPCDLVTLRRYATACLLLRFNTVAAHSDGNVIAESYEREIVGSDFALPEGFTFSGLNSEIGPTRSPESAFNERLCSALRAAKTLVPQAIERLGTKAVLPPALPGPEPALTAEQAIENVAASFDGGFFLSKLGWEVKSLAYQPLEVVAPLLGPMLREQELPSKVLGAVGTARDALAAHPVNFLLPLATIGLPQPPPPVKPPPPEPIAYVSERRARRPSRRSTQRASADPLPEVDPPPPRSPPTTRFEWFLAILATAIVTWLAIRARR